MHTYIYWRTSQKCDYWAKSYVLKSVWRLSSYPSETLYQLVYFLHNVCEWVQGIFSWLYGTGQALWVSGTASFCLFIDFPSESGCCEAATAMNLSTLQPVSFVVSFIKVSTFPVGASQ